MTARPFQDAVVGRHFHVSQYVLPFLVVLLVVFTCFFFVALSEAQAQQGLIEFEVSPETTDPEIDDWLQDHLVVFNASVPTRNQLFVFLPGTGLLPTQSRLLLRQAANNGYHTIGLRYPNSTTVKALCDSDPDLNCYEYVRREIIYGQDVSPRVDVNRANSIENRLVKLLQYLDQEYPADGWGQYLSGDTPEWSSILLSGHSQGGGHAAFIAMEHVVARVSFFAAPTDYDDLQEVLAPWLALPHDTATARYYGFVHVNDVWAPRVEPSWTALGMDQFGPPVEVDDILPPYGGSHQLLTAAPPHAGTAHTSIVLDSATPRLPDGSPQYKDVWQYIGFFETAPPSPTDLTAVAVSGSRIDLTWTDHAGNENGFSLERKTGAAGSWEPIATLGVDAIEYADTGLVPSTAYVYRVRATKNGTDSPYSNEAAATTLGASPEAPTVAVVRPSGGERLFTGTPYTIRWTAAAGSASLARFDVAVSTNGGATYSPVPGCTGLDGAARTCTWSAPGPVTTTARIRVTVTDTASMTNWDASDANVRIVAGSASLTVTVPNTAVQWAIGHPQVIRWWNNNLGPGAQVDLAISRDGGATWTPIATAVPNAATNPSSYAWTVTGPPTPTARIRVSWTDGAASDISNVNFTITDPVITLTVPSTGTTNWGYGTRRNVTWQTNLGAADRVNVLLSTDGGATFPIVLASDVQANQKSATVTMPSLSSPTTAARLRVESVTGAAVAGVSPVNFRIEPAFVTVTRPNVAGHAWPVGSSQTITWVQNLGTLENVKIELSEDGGETYPIVLVASTRSDGSHPVTVQGGWATTRGRVRITWLENIAVTDASNQNFPIQ